MEIGIDSFAGGHFGDPKKRDNVQTMENVLERIELADKVGLDFFGIGEHHRAEFLDSANHMILAAASQRTKNIKLGSAVTVLSAADPVRVFQNFATLDILSGGRAEIVAGRGSFTEAFPLFGYSKQHYSALFTEKLDMLLKIRENETLSWEGQFRAPLIEQSVYPRPVQTKLPIWRGVGGTPESFQAAGFDGLPLMVAIIGGETHRFRPLVDIYRRAFLESGHPQDNMKVGVHSQGYVAETVEKAIKEYFPGYKKMFDRIGRERGWPPVTMDRFLHQNSHNGAYLIGDPQTVAEKIVRHSESLGGVARYTFMIDNDEISQEQVLNSIELIGTEVRPRVQELLAEQAIA